MMYVCTIVLAACSMVYELILAQTVASVMGNTLLRYNITIGLYIASLGVGALIYKLKSPAQLETRLIYVEVWLAIIGTASPFIIVLLDSGFWIVKSHSLMNDGLITILMHGLVHSLIVIIGILSGMELHLLMDIAFARQRTRFNNILTADYLGTLLAAILFPLVLLPRLGLFGLACCVGLLNCLIAWYFVINNSSGIQVRQVTIAVMVSLFLLMGVLGRDGLHDFMVKKIYLPRATPSYVGTGP